MRVLYLNPFSQEVSGPDESLLTLLSGLIPLGVEPHVVIPRPGPQVERYEALGARVHYAPLTFLKRRIGPLELLSLLPRLVRGVLAVASIARTEKIHLIHTNMEVVLDGAFAARFLGLPHVLHYRGNTLDRPQLVFDILTRFWTAMSCRVVCISHATAEIFRKRGYGSMVEVLYNPVNALALDAAQRSERVRAELGASRSDVLVGTIGRIHPRKDLVTFLQAGALLTERDPRVRLAVIGTAHDAEETAYWQHLHQMVKELGLDTRVVWAGARRDIPAVLKCLDVLVLSSRHEGFGRVVAEALAAGTPVVGTREGAIPELLADGGGATATPADAYAFAEGILSEIESPHPSSTDQRSRFSHLSIATAVYRLYEKGLRAVRPFD